ncbi:hypothetical protein HYH03_008975 [Edaphochlamys debaryana]|uniref:Uncharacterized protein n=1 Tax=Edaphochlamys debaryana TaxID=47281 RepID=A0A835Y062_9CHLO|nr:hypothetical protein HYH03_008975 [Edaphochlamys debaryana]|eukprot:KAG2492817.1 hypothetical protein HYH03_008975 [Edaphochlamys debaryana]
MPIEVGQWLSGSAEPTTEPCGLFVEPKPDAKPIPVPLKRRDVTATIHADASFSDTKETLSYIADVDCTAVFKFPLPPRAAVYRFRAVIGDREVTTKVKPRAEAREEYDIAVSQGHSAVHMAQQEKGASVFEVSLGNLEAHTEVVVEFGYLRLLDAFGSTLEWIHTATWVPPYIGSAGDVAVGLDKVAASAPKFTDKVTYALSYKVTVLADPGTIKSIESPSPITLTKPPPTGEGAAGAGAGAGAWHVALSEAVADPSKDLTLLIEMEPAAARRSSLRAQRTPASRGGEPRTVVLATFVPPALPEAPPPAAAAAEGGGGGGAKGVAREIWFVVDCSGSMGGNPIQQAQEAALFFVRDLPVDSGVKFNVTCFGSSYKSLYESCRPYDGTTEKQAVEWIQNNVNADMGGTEILATLKHIYDSPVTPGYSREIIFLTDGGISGYEEQAVYDLVTPPKAAKLPEAGGAQADVEAAGAKEEGGAAAAAATAAAAAAATVTHVLSLGIGHGVHRGLLDGMATRTQGAAAYVVDEEAIAAKTAFLKKAALAQGAALRPRLTARGALIKPAPHVLPQRVFAGEPLHVLVEVLSCDPDSTLELTADYCAEPSAATTSSTTPSTASPSATAPEPAKLSISLPLGSVAGAAAGAAVEEGEALPVLHAMAYIGGLLAGTSPLHLRSDGSPQHEPPSEGDVKDAVVRLAVAEHLVTPHTSAVGVSLRRDPADPEAAKNVVEVPLQFPSGRTLFQQPPATAFRGYGGPPPVGVAMCNMAMPMAMACAAPMPMMPMPMPKMAMMARPGGFAQPRRMLKGAGGAAAPVEDLFGDAAMEVAEAAAPPPPPPAVGGAVPLTCSAPPQRPGGPPPQFAMGGGGPGAGGPPLTCTMPPQRPGGPPSQRPADIRARQQAAAAAPVPEVAYESAAALREEAQDDDASMGLDPFADVAPAAADDMGVDGAAAAEVAEADKASTAAGGRLTGSALLAHLNLSRTTQGYWRAGPELAAALGVPPEELLTSAGGGDGSPSSAPAAAALRPAGLSDDAWATVVVLACLRRALSGQREVWADMEAKAMAWLGGCWPAGGRSLGSLVIALAKEMPAAA